MALIKVDLYICNMCGHEVKVEKGGELLYSCPMCQAPSLLSGQPDFKANIEELLDAMSIRLGRLEKQLPNVSSQQVC